MKKTIVIKKACCFSLAVLCAFTLGGCWNYRGINETTIISGIGIDKDETSGHYRITYEIIDLTRDIKQTGVLSKIVEAEGKTLFEAARNAKKRLINRLYFGNTQIIVVSQSIAREGLTPIIDWFLRDGECRETITVAVSMQQTAEEMFGAKGIDERVVAHEMKRIVDKDQRITGSTRNVELYKIFNTLHGESVSLCIPAFHIVKNNGTPTAEVNGVAVFKKDKLIGFLTPLESNRYLYVLDEIKAGVLTLSLTDKEPDNITLEISKNKTKNSYSYINGRVSFRTEIKTNVYLDEFSPEVGTIDEQKIKDIEDKAEKKLQSEITQLIKRMQTEYDSDIFGFGNMIYKNDPKLWNDIHSEWDELFKTMDVDVECEISIVNTGALIK